MARKGVLARRMLRRSVVFGFGKIGGGGLRVSSSEDSCFVARLFSSSLDLAGLELELELFDSAGARRNQK
jgi:hypothetical protein